MSADNLEFWIGREAEVDRVVRGLLASADAHFLVTGFPGVGKSSFVSRVIAEWRRLCVQQGIGRVLIFNLQFAQPESAEQVVRRLIGSVFFGSVDGQFSPDKGLSERLQLSFIQAHSKTFKETQNQTTAKEQRGEATVDLPAVASVFGAGIKFGTKKSRESKTSLEVEREYNLSAAITDFEAVIHLLTKPEKKRSRKFWPFWPFATYETKLLEQRVLFIFDQIDDLDSVQALAPLFNLPKSSFIVLGGTKLKEQIADAKQKGLHVLDSFQEEYLQCQWGEAEKIFSLLVSRDVLGSRRFADYCDYLNFSAQGLPRRLFTAIDQHTHLIDDNFYLRLTPADLLRVRLGARLHRIIWRNRKKILGDYIDNVQYFLRDKALRGTYHLADRMFRSAQFTFHDADTVVTQMSDAIAHAERKKVLMNLLATFIDEGLIVKNGNNYALADSVIRTVRRIPDWLNDGFVDARTFMADLSKIHEPDAEVTGIVQVQPRAQLRSKGKPAKRVEDALPDNLKNELGRYKIINKIGSGGMGDVYLAEDKTLQRKVAIKIIHSRESKFSRARFMQEGRVIAQLDHPNIVRIFDVQELGDGRIALVTEFVEGDSLYSRIVNERGMPIEEAVTMSIEIASALIAAHRRGIVHRDIKPSNILLTADGHVKLVDFGIAKLSAPEVEDEEPVTKLTQTEPGMIIGTARYMSPEQFMGAPVDSRADLYSLGVVIYEMLTGRYPFEEQRSVIELAMKVLREQPQPPSIYNLEIPADLDQIVLKLLQKEPRDRFSTAGEVIDALKVVIKQVED